MLKAQVRKLSSQVSSFFLTYARLRFSDAMLSTKEPALDGHEGLGFWETELYKHKTANRRRTTINPLPPALGVHSGKWAEAWLEARKLGQEPEMSPDGSWSEVPMNPSDVAIKLREAAAELDSTLEVSKFGTHSCGYHAKPDGPNSMEYSRDAQTEFFTGFKGQDEFLHCKSSRDHAHRCRYFVRKSSAAQKCTGDILHQP